MSVLGVNNLIYACMHACMPMKRRAPQQDRDMHTHMQYTYINKTNRTNQSIKTTPTAIYSGVPHMETAPASGRCTPHLARPKSPSRTWPCASRRIFSGCVFWGVGGGGVSIRGCVFVVRQVLWIMYTHIYIYSCLRLSTSIHPPKSPHLQIPKDDVVRV